MEHPDSAFGIAGAATEQERASLRQVVFLLRYRERIVRALAAADVPA